MAEVKPALEWPEGVSRNIKSWDSVTRKTHWKLCKAILKQEKVEREAACHSHAWRVLKHHPVNNYRNNPDRNLLDGNFLDEDSDYMEEIDQCLVCAKCEKIRRLPRKCLICQVAIKDPEVGSDGKAERRSVLCQDCGQ